MSVRSKHLKLIGAAGAGALALGTIAAAPAIAASQDLTYNCTALGPVAASLDPGTIPATMVAGQTSKRTMNMVVHLNSTQADLARGQSVTGNVVSTGAHNTFPFNLTIPSQTVPATGGADITASGPGKIRPLQAGTWTVKAGDITANLTLSVLGAFSDTCTAPTDSTRNFGTITVSKDKTTTVASAAYSASKHIATGKAKVRSHFGLRATGTVRFTLKKGSTKIAALKGTLNRKGIAVVHFKNVKKHGKYSITAKYGGNANLKGSSDTATFSVG